MERIALNGQFGARRSAWRKRWTGRLIRCWRSSRGPSPEDTGWLRLFVPAVLFGLLRFVLACGTTIGARPTATGSQSAHCWFRAFLGITQPVTAIMALLVLASLFLVPYRGDRR